VLGPPEEVKLVKRICELYSKGGSFADLAMVGSVEGWVDRNGRPLSPHCIGSLLRNEALIGNFVWGRRLIHKSLLHSPTSRSEGSVPQIIDIGTWAAVQRQIALIPHNYETREQLLSKLEQALEKSPLLVTRDLAAYGLPSLGAYRSRMGNWAECLKQAGCDPIEHQRALGERGKARCLQFHERGYALAQYLTDAGLPMRYNGRLKVLSGSGLYIQHRLLWPAPSGGGTLNWRIRKATFSSQVDVQLLVRMGDECTPKDYFLAPPSDIAARFPNWLTEHVTKELSRFWFLSPDTLVQRLRSMADRQGAGA
jgi:hypothetical protein